MESPGIFFKPKLDEETNNGSNFDRRLEILSLLKISETSESDARPELKTQIWKLTDLKSPKILIAEKSSPDEGLGFTQIYVHMYFISLF